MNATRPRPRWPLLLLLLACCAVLVACATAPPAEDVAADRARWTAVRDLAADGQIDQTELQLIGTLLVAWDEKLTADEAAAGHKRTPQEMLAELLRVYGAAAVQVWLAPELQQRAPEAFRLVDRNGNGVLEAAELQAIDPTDPVFALVVATTAQHLLRGR